MYDLSGELTVMLTNIWWWQELGKDWQYVNKQHRPLIWKDLISGS
jgi:hypothetical protein